MKFLVSFWPLEAKVELTPFEEAAVRGEPETGRSLRSTWLLEAARVHSLLHHSLVASKGVPASQDGLNARFY